MKMTDTELKELKELYKDVQNTPVMTLSTADGLSGNDFQARAQKRFGEKWRAICMKYGLKHQETGFHSRTGEFVQG